MGAPYPAERDNQLRLVHTVRESVKRYANPWVVATFACLMSFSYGMFAATYQIFPFDEIREIKRVFVAERHNKANQPSKAELENWARKAMFEQAQTYSDIVFVGDSITQAGEWSEFFPTFRVLNRGINGDDTGDVLARLDHVLATNPHHAFIMLGMNDMLRAKELDTTLANYTAIIERLRDANINVVIQSTTQCSPKVCKEGTEHLHALNQYLRDYAEKTGIRFIDLGPLSDSTGLAAQYTYDGIHLNADGYRHWIESLTPIMSEVAQNQLRYRDSVVQRDTVISAGQE